MLVHVVGTCSACICHHLLLDLSLYHYCIACHDLSCGVEEKWSFVNLTLNADQQCLWHAFWRLKWFWVSIHYSCWKSDPVTYFSYLYIESILVHSGLKHLYGQHILIGRNIYRPPVLWNFNARYFFLCMSTCVPGDILVRAGQGRRVRGWKDVLNAIDLLIK